MFRNSDPADVDGPPPSAYFRFSNDNDAGAGPSQRDDGDELEELPMDDVVIQF